MRDEQLKQQALRLPRHERVELLAALIQSLGAPGEPVSEDEARQAWTKEAQRRAEAYDRGEMTSRAWEEFRDELRSRLA